MLASHALFLSIARKFEKNFKDIHKGTLMSNPAIEFRGRAFAFYKNDAMVIHLSGDDSPENYGIRGFRPAKLLNKSLHHWYEIPSYYQHDWEVIGEAELRKRRG
jgi:hypothetical protein